MVGAAGTTAQLEIDEAHVDVLNSRCQLPYFGKGIVGDDGSSWMATGMATQSFINISALLKFTKWPDPKCLVCSTHGQP